MASFLRPCGMRRLQSEESGGVLGSGGGPAMVAAGGRVVEGLTCVLLWWSLLSWPRT